MTATLQGFGRIRGDRRRTGCDRRREDLRHDRGWWKSLPIVQKQRWLV
ncbi:hypothetical protein [Labedella populi]|nr:hypothetical protein [Labedella populi]